MSKYGLRALRVKQTKPAYEIRGSHVKSSKDDALFLQARTTRQKTNVRVVGGHTKLSRRSTEKIFQLGD